MLLYSKPTQHCELSESHSVVSEVKVSAWNVGDLGSIPGWGRSPGERNGNPLQYSCLENPMEGGAWRSEERRGGKESIVTQTINNLPKMQETLVRSLGQEAPLEKEMAIHSSIIAW